MILIDKLIHECHKGLKEYEYSRPVAVNLIQGTMTRLIDFLDELAYGTESTPGTKKVKKVWRKRINDAMQRWGMK